VRSKARKCGWALGRKVPRFFSERSSNSDMDADQGERRCLTY
jgi:hypothetical protein